MIIYRFHINTLPINSLQRYTLEIFVIQPVRIYPDLEIGQVYFEEACGESDFLYRGRYQGQIEPTTSKLYLNNSELDKDYFYNEK